MTFCGWDEVREGRELIL